MQADLFDAEQTGIRTRLGEQAWVLRGFALPWLESRKKLGNAPVDARASHR
ncbi:hypothetical protein PVZ98_03435 [Bordetella pertussis]|nr:hypothetical protein PVZ98_03435 [Bordetella pertussis]